MEARKLCLMGCCCVQLHRRHRQQHMHNDMSVQVAVGMENSVTFTLLGQSSGWFWFFLCLHSQDLYQCTAARVSL
jgi:hypothetical protein